MNRIFLIFFLSIALTSCVSTKVVMNKREIKNISPVALLDSLKDNYGTFNSFSGKFKVVIKQDNKSNSLMGSVKIERDSAIWLSLNPGFGIEVARGLLLVDSMYFLERINSSYYKGTYANIKKIFSVDLNYTAIQSLLLNTISFYPALVDTQNLIIKREANGKSIEIENFGKREIKRKERLNNTNTVYEKTTVNNTNLKISEVILRDYKEDRVMRIKYSDFVYVDTIRTEFPQSISITINQKSKDIIIDLKFTKLQFNTKNEYSFSIPESYKPIQLSLKNNN